MSPVDIVVSSRISSSFQMNRRDRNSDRIPFQDPELSIFFIFYIFDIFALTRYLEWKDFVIDGIYLVPRFDSITIYSCIYLCLCSSRCRWEDQDGANHPLFTYWNQNRNSFFDYLWQLKRNNFCRVIPVQDTPIQSQKEKTLVVRALRTVSYPQGTNLVSKRLSQDCFKI